MGEVYKAYDRELDRAVALKFVRPEISSNSDALQRFKLEIVLAREITHRNVVRIHDVGELTEATKFISMEFVDGVTLADALNRRGKYPSSDAVAVIRQVLEGLTAAHACRVVHRDLKPTNIMCDPQGRVVIMDFGLARMESSDGSTSTGTVLGSIDYMSPEQAEGKTVDARSDLFTVGMIFYELLTGIRPFPAESPVASLLKRTRERPQPASSCASEVPEALSQICSKCLENRPEYRYQKAAEVIVDLDEWTALVRDGHPSRLPTVALGAPPTRMTSARPRRVIRAFAVLPFQNVEGDAETEYFSDGVTETLINSISVLPRLRVMARSTVFRYKGRDCDPLVAGRELRVDAVLTGRVVQRGDVLVIGTEVVDVETGVQLWGKQYNGRAADIFKMQEEIANEISEKLRLRLTGSNKRRLLSRSTQDVEAYHLYLRGRYQWNKRTPDTLGKSIEIFKQAIERDPSYALAYVGVADAYNMLSFWSYEALAPSATMNIARAAAQKALQIDETLAEGHTSLAFVKSCFEWDWRGAERSFKQAFALNRDYPTLHHWYSMHLANLGLLDQAISENRRALELDPLSASINGQLAYLLYLARRFPEAAEQCHRTLDMEPTFPVTQALLASVDQRVGRIEEGLDRAKRVNAFCNGRFMLAFCVLGCALAHAGYREDARKMLIELKVRSEREYVPSYALAGICAALNDAEESVAWLEEGYRNHSSFMPLISIEPSFDTVRHHPRFQDLLRRLGR